MNLCKNPRKHIITNNYSAERDYYQGTNQKGDEQPIQMNLNTFHLAHMVNAHIKAADKGAGGTGAEIKSHDDTQ